VLGRNFHQGSQVAHQGDIREDGGAYQEDQDHPKAFGGQVFFHGGRIVPFDVVPVTGVVLKRAV
jgi:hypothetical protein